jgi:hypothetical protein
VGRRELIKHGVWSSQWESLKILQVNVLIDGRFYQEQVILVDTPHFFAGVTAVERIIRGHHLSTGASKSCGCLAIEERSKTMKELDEKRWQNHKKHHPRLYRIWTDMRRRCLKENRPEYKNYGAQGIKVCQDWDSDFIAFHNWAMNNGYSDNLTIDRINPFGDYEPSNCRWITNQEPQRNRKRHVTVFINGESKRLWEMEALSGIPVKVIRQRIISGWSPERAVSEAIHKEFSHTSKREAISGSLF